jgi:hypothetical protein
MTTHHIERPDKSAALHFFETPETPAISVTVTVDPITRQITIVTQIVTDGEGYQWTDHSGTIDFPAA